MTGQRTDRDPLAPLRAALVERARADAAAIRAEAERGAQGACAAATQRSAELLSEARAQGEQDAREAFHAEQARARAAARAVVLAAQREVYEQLRAETAAAVRTLLAEPAAHARLVATVQARLGEPCELVDAPGGGVLARTAAGRIVDASVDALVDQALSRLDLEQLWTPQ